MRKAAVALVVGVASCGVAQAQSSVTLYGALDAGITYTSNQGGKSNVFFQSGVNNPDPWGIKGAEDLGGGTRALFKLEGYFNLGTGAMNGGGIFAHQAYVGIQNDNWGTVTAGDQYDFMLTSLASRRWGPMILYVSPFMTQAGPFSKLNAPGPFGMFDFDRTAGTVRVNNSVMYQSPVFNGLTAGAMYGFGGQPGSFGLNSAQSFGIDYANGPLALDAAYTYQKYPTIANGSKGIRNYGVGGRYAIGKNFFDVLYTDTANTANGARIDVYEVGALIPMARALNLHIQYEFMQGNQFLSNNKAHQVGATLDYSLSVRTGIYASVLYQHASGDAAANAYIIGMLGPSSSGNQTAVRIGLRTRF
ncbi:porin [Burkholderia vietnamiensis]|uniref:Porin n=1 Tax=Burkholderia vietnamiensis TaxID=60552 RepID=A0AAW7TAR5_BURVI|nr:porin [Burkholderia vietnamiensis]MDN7799297.1 porin [Burkholderia vietnamiensis]